MDIHTNIPLKNYLTMRLGGNARFMTDANTPEEMAELCRNARAQGLRTVILGGGSNTLAHDEGFDGLIIRNRLRGIQQTAEDDTGDHTAGDLGRQERPALFQKPRRGGELDRRAHAHIENREDRERSVEQRRRERPKEPRRARRERRARYKAELETTDEDDGDS